MTDKAEDRLPMDDVEIAMRPRSSSTPPSGKIRFSEHPDDCPDCGHDRVLHARDEGGCANLDCDCPEIFVATVPAPATPSSPASPAYDPDLRRSTEWARTEEPPAPSTPPETPEDVLDDALDDFKDAAQDSGCAPCQTRKMTETTSENV